MKTLQTLGRQQEIGVETAESREDNDFLVIFRHWGMYVGLEMLGLMSFF